MAEPVLWRPTASDGPIERLLSWPDVAAIFVFKNRLLRQWEKAGHLVPLRSGRSISCRIDDVEPLIKQRMTDTALARLTAREANHPVASNTAGISAARIRSHQGGGHVGAAVGGA